MSDRWALAAAAGAAGGALAGAPVPLWAVVVLAAVALAWHRPLLVLMAVTAAASLLAARAEAGLVPPPPSTHRGWVTLVSDPEQVRGAVRVEVRGSGRRLQAWARGRPAAALRDRLAGEQVLVVGRISRLSPGGAARLRSRHVVGRLVVDEVVDHRPGALHTRAANAIRRTLERGTVGMAEGERSLLTGFVFGDDRGQPVAVADDFRAAGLTHLLAVSGQNVAFALLLAGPALRRLGPRWRVVGAAVVLGLFGTITRWEPSVIRAVAMAGVALWATAVGRPASSRRTLALAVTILLLIDPLLVHSVGFVLSVGACLGIAVLAGPIAARLPGPGWIRLPVAVTAAAQAGVAPVLVPVFGGVPVASLPANLLAGPAAGPVMVWGLAGGLVAGVLGPPAAGLIHLPTRALLAWIRAVAWAAGLAPLGELGRGHLAALAVVGLGAWRVRRAGPVIAAALVVLVLPALALARRPDVDGAVLTDDAVLWRRGDAVVVVVSGRPYEPALLEGLRRRGVRRIDVAVLAGRSSLPALDVIRQRHPVRRVAAVEGAEISDAVPARPGDRIGVGPLRLVVAAVEPRLRLASEQAGAAGGPAPGR